MKINLILISFLALTLIACATTSTNSNTGVYGKETKIEALLKVKNDVSLIMEVPAASNAISNTIMLASIKSGADSTAVIDLVNMLRKNVNTVTVTVIGSNDAIVAATIESAVNRMAGSSSSAKIYFVGEQKYGDELKALSAKTGIQIDSINYP